ncbi:neuroligin-4, X-linked-like [Littorina saxatilis]|uniref:Carboxylesterase type B domain-containing protein n=1 Tax=Littorina saxatilis TaxID=31220 RepID=A0AAN9B7Y2_9CAEN
MTVVTVAFIVLTTIPLCVSEDVVVTTKNGELRGRRVSTGQTSYLDTFLGIPFAAPPVGPLRFKAPQPPASWTGTRDSTRFSAMCPQLAGGNKTLDLPISEDCLYLNIYSPNAQTNDSLLPVMFWIHGGFYIVGSGASFNGTALTSRGVVVVTINYRLGALGFLSTLDAASPGNNGLLDQILALKWVKDNIALFHGDPNDVTIFGQSAGSGSVSLLRLSPLAQGLFSKAIMESGVSLSHWAVARPGKEILSPLQYAQRLGTAVGCGSAVNQSNAALVDCLRNMTVERILNGTNTVYIPNSQGVPAFNPTVETVVGVIPEDPRILLTRGSGSNVTSIRGINSKESAGVFLEQPLSYFTLPNVEAEIAQFTKIHFFRDNPVTVANKIVAQYITSQHLTTAKQYREALIQINTDFTFTVPTILEQQHTAMIPGHAPQYLYQFSYRASHDPSPSWAGAMHSSELPFVFGAPFMRDRFSDQYNHFNWTSEDSDVSGNMMTLWTSFAKDRNPSPHRVVGGIWAPYSLDSQDYLDIGSSLTITTNLATDRVKFWKSILDKAQVLIG